MNVHERLLACKEQSFIPTCLKGKKKPPFPEVVDNTMRTAFRKCEVAFRNEFLFNRVMGADNIHLVAGAAFAAANDAFRKSYYYEKDFDKALDAAMISLIQTYGYHPERDDDPEWANHAKSCDRLLQAVVAYWTHWNPKYGKGKLMVWNGEPASECGFLIPLKVNNPDTGQPLLYSVRFDYVEERGGRPWLGDDKTTSSLGTAWANQWWMRGQFLGYTYAAREFMGIQAAGVIARGTGILKTDIKHLEVPVSFPPHLTDLWWEQVNKDFQKMVDAWDNNDYNYDMSDGCAAYGGCKFQDACRSKFQANILNSMPVRVWNPAHPEDSPVVMVEQL